MSWQDVDYDSLIPNNVGLAGDPKLLRALEKWHPGYIDWWMSMGPEGFQMADVYLRTAISVEKEGWARFGYVKMPEYRWGILLAPEDWWERHPEKVKEHRRLIDELHKKTKIRICSLSWRDSIQGLENKCFVKAGRPPIKTWPKN